MVENSTVEQTVKVEVRYFAAAVDAAGCEKETLDLAVGADIATLREALSERHGADMARVLGVAAFLVEPGAPGAGDGELTRDPAAAVGTRVDVLPPFAGG